MPVAAYSGQLEGPTRHQLEDALRDNRLKALVATSALGMGYDKPDLGFVVHVGSPPSPVSYYQQVGRAGRAIDHAHAVLLPSDADAGIWDYFATSTIPQPEQVAKVLAVLSDEPRTVVALEAESGALIHAGITGVADLRGGAMERLLAGEHIPWTDMYVRSTARFETADEELAWLSSTVAIGINELGPDHVDYRFFRVL